MEYVEFIIDALGSAWALWLFGLVFSYRMIAPAQSFLSPQSAEWVTQRLRERRFTGLARRFAVSFKRYVDRVFGATPRRVAGCRVWTLRFMDCAMVSFLTFLGIFWFIVLSLDQQFLREAMVTGVEQVAAQYGDFPIADILKTPASIELMVYGGLFFGSIILALVNIFADYVSFLETRNVLARMGRRFWQDLGLIGLDLVLTATIAAAGIVLAYTLTTLAGTVFTGRDLPFDETLLAGFWLVKESLVSAGTYLAGGNPGLGFGDLPATAMSLSTFATSIWIWVFFTGTLMLRLVIYLVPVMNLIVFLVDIQKHPFRAVWLMFAIGWSVAIGIAAVIS